MFATLPKERGRVRVRKWIGLALAGVGVMVQTSACAPKDGGMEGTNASDTARTGDPLVATLEVEEGGSGVRLLLHVTNSGTAPVQLEFRSGQRFDFAVTRPDGREVWRWSADRMFTQALGSEELGPGESLRYDATWDPRGETGEFVATGEVSASGRTIRQSTRFEL